MSNRTIRILIIAVLLTALTMGLAHSASFTYAKYRKEIKAGVLIFPKANIDGSLTYADPAVRSNAPYLFQVLNMRTDIKPQGWDFTNPLAPSRVTDEIAARWNVTHGPKYSAGNPVTKEMGCYWEVKIDAGLTELAQFDILYAGVTDVMSLGRVYREKLRKMVDAGGVLWIENCNISDKPAGFTNFFVPDVYLEIESGTKWAAAPNPVHPVVHRPYDLTWDELSRLGTDHAELRGLEVHRVGTRVIGFPRNNTAARYFLTAVGLGGSLGQPIVAASQYGSGHIIASAESIGYAISIFGSSYQDNGGYLRRNGTYCPSDRASLAPTEDAKAAINIVSWGGEHNTFHKNARHTAYSFDEVGAPLALKWNFDSPSKPNAPTTSSPAFLNDMVFYVDGGGILHAFDLSPAQDLPMPNGSGGYVTDGNPDDFAPGGSLQSRKIDYAVGAPYDEVWSQSCGHDIVSSPTAALVPVGGGAAVPAVFVATLDGKVLGFNAMTGMPLPAGNPILSVAPYNTHSPVDIVPAPTYFDGTLYVGDGMGNLQAANLLQGYTWRWPLVDNPGLPPITNSPTVGYFRNPITGSVDQLVYAAAAGIPNRVNGCVYSFPIRIYNEVLTPAPGVPNQYRVRKYQQMAIKNDPEAFELYYTLPGGGIKSIPDASVKIELNTPGTFQILPSTVIPAGASVVADYEIDLTRKDLYPPQYRQRIDVKNPINTGGAPPGGGVSSTPAASPNDTLYYATDNGSFYAVIEDGWGITTKWRWYLGDPGPAKLLGNGSTGAAKAVGSPAVGPDKVYFAVNGVDSAGRPSAYILAFDADPVFRINVGMEIDPRRPVEVLQYDSMNPGREPIAVSGAAEGTDTSRRRVAFKVDYEKGRITIENFLDPLSASQSLVVRFFPPTDTPGPGARIEQIHSPFPGEGDIRYDDYWNNLDWCLKVTDMSVTTPITQITSSPMLMGGLLYFGGDDGRVHAVNVNRINQMVDRSTVTVNDDIHSVWPDLSMPPLGGPVESTIGGAHGNIAVSSPEGLAVLYNALTLVADNRRVFEMDASGQVIWSCDSTSGYINTRLSGTSMPIYAANKVAFNRPAVARRIGTSNVLVADTGNNRVVLIDRGGNVLCEVNDFRDPNNILPTGRLEPVDPKDPSRGKVSMHKLNAPADAWIWTVPGPTKGSMAYRFLIADTGNYRVVEVEAIYDPVTGRYSRVNLVWATHTLEQGKRYRYTSARRYPKPTGGVETICVIDNFVPEADRLETTGGAIVTVITDSTDPRNGLIVGNPDDQNDPNYGVRRFVEIPYGGGDTNVRGQYRVVNPTFFNREFKAGGVWVDLIGDANGLYMAKFMPDGALAEPVKVYRGEEHKWVDPSNPANTVKRPLLVSHAQLLPSGHVLVTNRAPSLSQGIPDYAAQGEVFEIRHDPTTGIPNYPWRIVWPTVGTVPGQGSYSWEQPSSAERLFQ